MPRSRFSSFFFFLASIRSRSSRFSRRISSSIAACCASTAARSARIFSFFSQESRICGTATNDEARAFLGSFQGRSLPMVMDGRLSTNERRLVASNFCTLPGSPSPNTALFTFFVGPSSPKLSSHKK